MSSKGNIKKFEDYEIEEFLSDEFFVQWVKNPDDNTTHFWEKWMGANPRKRAMVTKAAEIIRSVHSQPQAFLSDESYVEIFENIIRADEESKSAFAGRTSKEEKWYSFFSLRRVAVLFLVGLASWAVYATWPSPKEETIPQVQWLTKANPKGQKTTIRLKDGTRIHLNSNTILSYPQRFSDSLRTVKLENGEAFFDVKKENRPFTVLMANAEIEVLGTSFNVNHQTDRSLAVALIEGSVKVKDALGNQVMLSPSEMLRMNEDGKLEKSTFDPREITGWIDSYLVFKNDDFAAVVLKLENWYGVEIRTEGEFPKNWSYSGIYFDESLENTLEGISQTSGITYSIDHKTVTIKKTK